MTHLSDSSSNGGAVVIEEQRDVGVQSSGAPEEVLGDIGVVQALLVVMVADVFVLDVPLRHPGRTTWMDRQTDGWVNGWTGRWMGEWMDRPTYG